MGTGHEVLCIKVKHRADETGQSLNMLNAKCGGLNFILVLQFGLVLKMGLVWVLAGFSHGGALILWVVFALGLHWAWTGYFWAWLGQNWACMG